MSFNIGLSGLNASNTELNTISNNIANVSTTGFKGSRTEFASVYNGGQAGGVSVAAISQNFDAIGNINSTGRILDMAIAGGGFFMTKDSAGQAVYTRSGIFDVAADGSIVSNTGNMLQGYPVDDKFNLQNGTISDLKINTAGLAAKATEGIGFVANLDATADVVTTTPFDASDVTSFTNSYTTQAYDSLGNPHTITQYFAKTASNTWDVHTVIDGNTAAATTNTLTFSTDGTLVAGSEKYKVSFTPAGAESMSIELDLTGTTQYGNNFVVSKNNPDGYTSGEFNNLAVGDDGSIYAMYTNGQSQLQGQVILADFASPQGLTQVGGTGWTQSLSSGQPLFGTAGVGTFGVIASGALEGSNVDLTESLVSLMTAQRNYQANTKTISTSNDLTQALFNAV